jgi:DNA mismatch endonuclease (patch repair protein)
MKKGHPLLRVESDDRFPELANKPLDPARFRLMSRISSEGTKPERRMEDALTRIGLPFERQARDLSGRPDIVFRDARVALFVDGNFWHGYRFDAWKADLNDFWRRKISANMALDRRVRRELRVDGWTSVRIWEHQVQADAIACARRVAGIVKQERRAFA